MKPLQFYSILLLSTRFSSRVSTQNYFLLLLKMLRSDHLTLHTLAGCCRVSVVALSEKYSLGSHSELSTLSSCLVKRRFWLYFSDVCERV